MDLFDFEYFFFLFFFDDRNVEAKRSRSRVSYFFFFSCNNLTSVSFALYLILDSYYHEDDGKIFFFY